MKRPTRQAETEIGAYAAEIRSYLPLLAESYLVNVIISSKWPSLLCHSVYNDIVWLNKMIICLELVQVTEGVTLKVLDPQIIIKELKAPSISAKQLSGD